MENAPHTEQYLKQLAEKVFKPISQNFSVNLVSAPKVGKTSILKYLVNNADLIDDQYCQYIGKLGLFWINLHSDEFDLKSSLFDEINTHLDPQERLGETSTWREVERVLIKINRNYDRLVIVVDNAELLQYLEQETLNRLVQLNRDLSYKLIFIFLTGAEIEEPEVLRPLLRDLYAIYTGNPAYYPLLDDAEMEYVTKMTANESIFDISPEEVSIVKKLSGNHPGLMRILLRDYAVRGEIASADELFENHEAKVLFLKIWNSFSESTQAHVLSDKKYLNEYLQKSGLKNEKGEWFTDIYEKFVQNIVGDRSVKEDDLEGILSWQQLAVYGLLKEKTGETITRDDIAKALWGEKWADKYSDWAIEQVMSQLRKKLSAFKDIEIKTVYGEGFVLLKR